MFTFYILNHYCYYFFFAHNSMDSNAKNIVIQVPKIVLRHSEPKSKTDMYHIARRV